MSSQFYRVNTTLTNKECHWFYPNEVVTEGTVVRKYDDITHGCCSSEETAITFNLDGSGPFLGIPKWALDVYVMD